ncbi:MAG TPA: thioredoxin domain-containing protein, partial [Anaerolineales bacterium]
EHFVNIKVDREERPDLDSIYMSAVVALTGQGGWPMSVFLTPGGQPFFGGTYFPPAPRYGMPSFMDVLQSIAQAWQKDRSSLLQSGQEMSRHLQEAASPAPGAPEPLNPSLLEQAAMRLAQTYDWKHGGWGSAPKFPQPMAIEFLLRRAARGDRMALDMSVNALRRMARGGMYDVVGGGFARYSTDNDWLIPHFEKMLYDNAQLARAYLHAFLLTRDLAFRWVCEETLDFVARDLRSSPGDQDQPNGGFFSSLDADSEGEEGKFYLWSPDEIRAAIEIPADAEFFLAAYGVTEAGNFEGKTVLQRALDDSALAGRFGLQPEQVPARLAELHAQLLAVRARRVWPGTDDKVLVSWNALALEAFAEAARYLDRPDYLEIARLNADFLLTELNPHDRLLRSWRSGQARHNAYLEDYAGLILGLLSLYQSDPDPYWFSSAHQLAGDMLDHFRDPQGGFFDTRDDHGPLLTRPKDLQDNATPSGSSLAATALLQLAAFTGSGEYRDLAEAMLGGVQATAVRYPTAFSNWLCAIDLASNPILEVAILGDPADPLTQALVAPLWTAYRPHALLALSSFPPPSIAPPLLQDRPLVSDRPTAYVCRNFACQRPVNDPQEFLQQLN